MGEVIIIEAGNLRVPQQVGQAKGFSQNLPVDRRERRSPVVMIISARTPPQTQEARRAGIVADNRMIKNINAYFRGFLDYPMSVLVT